MWSDRGTLKKRSLASHAMWLQAGLAFYLLSLVACVMNPLKVVSSHLLEGDASAKSCLQGLVIDVQVYQPVIGATVKIKQVGSAIEFSGATNIDGKFSIKEIPGGLYSISVECEGFEPIILNNVTIAAHTLFNVRITLRELSGKDWRGAL